MAAKDAIFGEFLIFGGLIGAKAIQIFSHSEWGKETEDWLIAWEF